MKTYGLLKRKSQVFIAVLIVLAVVLTLGVTLLFRSRSFRSASSSQMEAGQAYSLAKSGLDIAASMAGDGGDPCGGGGPPELPLTTYTIGEDAEITLEITAGGVATSTGIMGDSVRVLTKTFAGGEGGAAGWAKVYGGSNSDYLTALRQTTDSVGAPDGYILGGRSASFTSKGDFLVIKTDLDGVPVTNFGTDGAKTYGGSAEDALYALQLTNDIAGASDGYILGGRTRVGGGYYCMLVKTDLQGRVGAGASGTTWATTYDIDGSSERILSVDQTTNSGGTVDGYILGGYTRAGEGLYDFLAFKTDLNGDPVLSFATTGTPTGAISYGTAADEELKFLQQTSDRGYILGGFSRSAGGAGDYDFLLIKTDVNGAPEASAFGSTGAKAYGGSGYDQLYTLQQTSDNGYILGGNTKSFGESSGDFLVIKTDSQGRVGTGASGTTWAKTYGGDEYDKLSFLQQTTDGGYILGGFTNSYPAGVRKFLVIKIDLNGTPEVGDFGSTGAKSYCDTGAERRDHLYALQQTSDGGYILGGVNDTGGSSMASGQYEDFMAIKIDSQGKVYNPDCAECTTIVVAEPGITLGSVTGSIIVNDLTIATGDPTVSPGGVAADVDRVPAERTICPD